MLNQNQIIVAGLLVLGGSAVVANSIGADYGLTAASIIGTICWIGLFWSVKSSLDARLTLGGLCAFLAGLLLFWIPVLKNIAQNLKDKHGDMAAVFYPLKSSLGNTWLYVGMFLALLLVSCYSIYRNE